MLTLAWYFPFFKGCVYGLAAMVLHECGHIVGARIFGVNVKTVGLGWKGIYTVREAGTPAKNLGVSLAGPLTNVALLLLWPISKSFFLANLCFAIFNLLPMKASDGDRILSCWRQMKAEKATKADASASGTASGTGASKTPH